MGSFNTTCFASQQTIAPDDPCYVIPVMQSRGFEPVDIQYDDKSDSLYGIADSTCYPSAFWAPIGGFLEARYADYGHFKLSDTPANRIRLLNLFQELLSQPVKSAAGDNSVHDIPFDLKKFVNRRKKLKAYLEGDETLGSVVKANSALFKQLTATWDTLAEVAQEHRLFATDWEEVARPVQLAVLHKDSFDALIAEAVAANPYKKALEPQAFLEQSVVKVRKVFAERGEAPDESEALTQTLFAWKLGQEFDRLGKYEGLTYPSEMAELDELTEVFFKGEESLETLYARLKPTLDARYAIKGLAVLNLKFSPMVSADQDYVNEVGSRFARFVTHVSRSATARREVTNEEA